MGRSSKILMFYGLRIIVNIYGRPLRPVEHINFFFHCPSNVGFFRQAHKRPTKLNDQFLEDLTC